MPRASLFHAPPPPEPWHEHRSTRCRKQEGGLGTRQEPEVGCRCSPALLSPGSSAPSGSTLTPHPFAPAPSFFHCPLYHEPSLPNFLSFSSSLFLPSLGFRVVWGAWRQNRIYSWKKHPLQRVPQQQVAMVLGHKVNMV